MKYGTKTLIASQIYTDAHTHSHKHTHTHRYKMIHRKTWPNHKEANDKKAVTLITESVVGGEKEVVVAKSKVFIKSVLLVIFLFISFAIIFFCLFFHFIIIFIFHMSFFLLLFFQ